MTDARPTALDAAVEAVRRVRDRGEVPTDRAVGDELARLLGCGYRARKWIATYQRAALDLGLIGTAWRGTERPTLHTPDEYSRAPEQTGLFDTAA